MKPGEIWQFIGDESVVFYVINVDNFQERCEIFYLSYESYQKMQGRTRWLSFATLNRDEHRRIA